MKKVAFLLLFFIGCYHTYSRQTDLDNEGSPADPVARMAAVNNLKISDWKPGGMNEEYLSAENYNIIIEALCRNKLEEYKDPRYTYNAEVLTTLPKNGLKKDLDVYYFKDANENYIVYILLSNNENEFSKVTEQVSKILTGRKYDPFCSYLVTGFTMNKTNDTLYARVEDTQVEMAIYKHKADAQRQMVLLTIIQRSGKTPAPQPDKPVPATGASENANNSVLPVKTFFLPDEFTAITNVENIRQVKNRYYFFSGTNFYRLHTGNGSCTKLNATAGLKNLSNPAFTDNYIYCFSHENNYYRAWRIDPEADKLYEVALPSKKEFKVKPAVSNNQNSISLTGFKDRVLLNYSVYFAPTSETSAFGTAGDLYVARESDQPGFIFLDNYTFNGSSFRLKERFGYAGDGSFYKNTFVASQYKSHIDYTHLSYIDYDSIRKEYKAPLDYKVSAGQTKVRILQSHKDDIYIVYDIYDQNSTELVTRELFKFRYPQIVRLGKLGVYKTTDNLAMQLEGDDVYLLSGRNIYKYVKNLNALSTLLSLKEDERFSPFRWDSGENSNTFWVKQGNQLIYYRVKGSSGSSDWKFMSVNLEKQLETAQLLSDFNKAVPAININEERLFAFNNNLYFLLPNKAELADLYQVNFQAKALEKVNWSDDIGKNLKGFKYFSASTAFLKLEAVYENGKTKEQKVLLLSTIQ
ncbi:MAG: hypothetical protein IPN39_16820 [Chitinophagaceae bacterium]|nr:hypothetical protein [Chitinophagaceae bacterium]